jgi:hypothetical protein
VSNFAPAEILHRLVKQVMDSGAVQSLAEAEALFRGYRLTLAIEPAEGQSLVHQAALLTALALGRRVFLGGVTVAGDLDVPLMAPLPLACQQAASISS